MTHKLSLSEINFNFFALLHLFLPQEGPKVFFFFSFFDVFAISRKFAKVCVGYYGDPIGRNIFEQDAQRPTWDATTSGGFFWLSDQTKYNCVCILTTRLPLTMQRQKWDPALAR